MILPSFLYRKDGKINASCLRESWFKQNKIKIYNEIKDKVIPLFPKNYKASSYSENLYHYFHNLGDKHICNHPNCNNVSVFKNFGIGFLDYCSKKCRGSHIKIKNKEKNKHYEEEKKEEIRKKIIFKGKEQELNKLGIDFFNIEGEINANKVKESYILKHFPEIGKNINEIKNKFNIGYNQALYHYIYDIKEFPKCKYCNNKLKYKTLSKGYGKYCNNICFSKDEERLGRMKNSLKNTIKNKYGEGITTYFQTKEFKDKKKKTSLLKYNTEYPSQSEIVKEKRNSSIIKKYGSKENLGKFTYKKGMETLSIRYDIEIKNPMEIPGIKEKIQNTNIKRYGSKNVLDKGTIIRNNIEKCWLAKCGSISPFGSEKVKIKTKKTILEKIKKRIDNNLIYNISEEEFIKRGIYAEYKFQCKKCKNFFIDTLVNNTYKTIFCKKCRPRNISKYEIEIKNYIVNIIGISLINVNLNNKKELNGKELDIFIKNKNLAIEYNGLMWHSFGKHKSSMFNNFNQELILSKKHLYKTELCIEKGIILLHIFENEWLNKIKQNIWKNIIQSKLGKTKSIYGRKTYIKEVSNENSQNFLIKYHLQGNIGAKIKIGLYDNKTDELLSLMTFGKSRFDKNIDWEILRFVTKGGINIIGGASKIFKYFLNKYVKRGESIKTYADLRFSNGEVYKKLGFELISHSKPNYFYFKTNSYNLESRVKYQKHKIKEKYKKGELKYFDENLTESENMYNNGYRKIYDCGNLVFNYIK